MNQEIKQVLKEYIRMENGLKQLAQKKESLEKKIRFYQATREPPQPQRPSKIRTFLIDFLVCLFATYLSLFYVMRIPNVSAVMLLLTLFVGIVLLPIIITPIHYKKRDSDALTRYVTAGMKYNEWEEGKKKNLPVLREQLNIVINDGKKLYQEYKNAKLRTILHPDYLPYAGVILGYFERGRVRDLTGAVNLLEQELLEQRRDMETAAYRKRMQQQAQWQTEAIERGVAAAERGATAAEIGAVFSAATFISNTKKGDNT